MTICGKICYNKIKNKFNAGILPTDKAVFNNEFGYLDYVFTPNIVEFVQGALYGISICANMISLYNRSHNISVRERKKSL